MTFEEMIPYLKDKQPVGRTHLYGVVKIVDCPKRKQRIVVTRGKTNFAYRFSKQDIFSNDWRVLDQ